MPFTLPPKAQTIEDNMERIATLDAECKDLENRIRVLQSHRMLKLMDIKRLKRENELLS